MIEILKKIENLMLVFCTLSDNSFLKLFFTYAVFVVMYSLLMRNIEQYLGCGIKVRLYDLIFIVALFVMFAWNSYHLYVVKVNTGTPSFKIKKDVLNEY